MKQASLLIFALCQICQAELVRFEEANFAIDFPASWKKDQTPPGALALYRSADNAKGVTLMTMKFSPEDAPTALGKMVSGAKKEANKSNVPITGEHEMVIDGVAYNSYSMTLPGDISVNSRMAVVGERGYSIQGFSGVSDAATDPEIAGILGSFQLLAKSSAPSAVDLFSKSDAYEFGQIAGRCAVIALIAGAVVLTVLKVFKGSNKPV